MYLFYCGTDSSFGREELWSPYFFIFIQEKQHETIVTRVGLEKTYPNGFSQWTWNLYCINTKSHGTNDDYDSRDVLNEIKEALKIYGLDGDPRDKDDFTFFFNF